MQPISCDMWLMEPNALRKFKALAATGSQITIEQVRENARKVRKEKRLAVIPVHGALEARYSLIGELFGMSSYEQIGMQFDEAISDDATNAVVMDFCTPGGMVYGCQELATKIFEARGKKPIIAVVNPMAASGGQWLAAACDRVVVTPGSDVGSIGVINEHVELSVLLENSGINVTLIRSEKSPYKWEANDSEPLSDEAKSYLQDRADKIYQQFIGDVAKFRGVTVDFANENFGKGRLVDAKTAVSVGLADRIDTLQGTVIKALEGRIRLGGNSAQDIWGGATVDEDRRKRATELASRLTVSENN